MDINPKDARWLLTEKYHGNPCPAYEADLERLRNGEPLAYIIGHIPFLGAHIDLSEHTLIPRPETEWWVNEVLTPLKATHSANTPLRILDAYTGSGCIGIACALALPHATVDLTDLSPTALTQAKRNCQLNRVDDRTRVLCRDGLRSLTGPYDLICANPPYIAIESSVKVDSSVLLHEPHEALFATEAGLAHIRHLLESAPALLSLGGMLCVEFDDGQESQIPALAHQSAFHSVTLHQDQYGRWRWFTATLPT